MKRRHHNMDEHYCGCNCSGKNKCSMGVYGLGFIGAAIYYISTAATFWIGVLGVLKAIVWPAIVVYEFLKFLGV